MSSTTSIIAQCYCCTWSHSMTHTHTHTLHRTPLDEGSADRRDLYLYNTQQSQESDMHAPGEIRTLNPNKQAAADLRLTRLCNPKAKFPVKPVFSIRQIYIRGAALHKTLFWWSTRRREHKSNSHKTSSFTIPLITTRQQKGEGINLINPSKFPLNPQHHNIQSCLYALCEILNRRRLTSE